MKLNNKIIKALFEAKINRSINESYATVKERFIRDGADKSEVKSLLDLHKKLKDMRRLKDNEINDSILKRLLITLISYIGFRLRSKMIETINENFYY